MDILSGRSSDVYYLSVRDGFGCLSLVDVGRWMLYSFQSVNIIVLMVISDLFTQNYSTPLHLAAEQGHHEICRYIIEHGANAEIQDKVRDGH